jgi:hypothetical protein
VEQAMAHGLKPERIAYVSFTKKAADEAAHRAQERFRLAADRFPHFKTLHAIAFRALHVRRDDIMQEEHFQELGRTLGFQFTSLDDEFSWMPIGTALGDKVERIQALSRQRGVTLEEQWYDSNYRDVPWLAVGQWTEGLKRFKDSRGLMDYTDLLEGYDEALDVDLFIVDESQDLSPLQWKVVKSSARTAKAIYLAGDDDQCIYGWAGADVRKFLTIPGNVQVLPLSYRLPRKVHKLAEQIVQRIAIRQPKQWTSRDEDGVVNWNFPERSLDFSKGKWLLARKESLLSTAIRGAVAESGLRLLEGRQAQHKQLDNQSHIGVAALEKRQPVETFGRSADSCAGPGDGAVATFGGRVLGRCSAAAVEEAAGLDGRARDQSEATGVSASLLGQPGEPDSRASHHHLHDSSRQRRRSRQCGADPGPHAQSVVGVEYGR